MIAICGVSYVVQPRSKPSNPLHTDPPLPTPLAGPLSLVRGLAVRPSPRLLTVAVVMSKHNIEDVAKPKDKDSNLIAVAVPPTDHQCANKSLPNRCFIND
ncbi:hypothetical protein F2P81_021150 [Scophthalmus maximus]|uniref:Uncharacterized protein n=1 Tax=Scophthalmus maximus TaxID=52904 RepID=A0A6A4RWH2_SCOMX|nr:hypothetical protein F2P81_021150 [Scophthalmus maximus]